MTDHKSDGREGDVAMVHRVVAGWMAVMALGLVATSSAQTTGYAPLPRVSAVRLYVIDCGSIVDHRPEAFGLTREEVTNPNHVDPCFLVRHPNGMLLFDTGISDALVGRPIYENLMGMSGQVKFTTLKGELANIGVTASMVTYFAISHSHWDHVGNANDYAGSTWLARRAEYDMMFPPGASTAPAGTTTGNAAGNAAPRSSANSVARRNYAALAQARTQFITGDHDVFGDGSVVLLSTPGHTPGHQSLYVKLARTGGVVISGDLYHMTEEITLNRIPDRDRNADTIASRKKIDDFLRRTGSQLWVEHAIDWFRDAVKSPGWYE